MINRRLRAAFFLIFAAVIPLRLAGQTYPWIHFTLNAGPSLDGTSLVYDPSSEQIIGFAGLDEGCCNSENYVWLLTNANGVNNSVPQWTQESPAGTPPAVRSFASAVYDQTNNLMIVFGGGQFGGQYFNVLFNDVWVLSNANGNGGTPTWTQLSPLAPNGFPAAREGHSAVYDSANNRMTIFGGGNNGIMDVPNDAWVLTNANGMNGQPEWMQLSPKGALPAARQNFAMAYDQAANSVVLFGGCCPSFNDQWVLKNANGLGGSPKWQQLSPAQPPAPRQNNGSFGYDVGGDYDPTKADYNAGTNSLVLFGGLGYNPAGTVYNDVWFLADAVPKPGAPMWSNLIPNGSSFPPPSVPPGVYDGAFTSLPPYMGGSKRLMTFPDASDLWILTTRNAIDISCSAGDTFDSSVLTQIQQAGIQYVVVKTPQSDTRPVECNDQVEIAQKQLDAFSKGFKTAAYCFLHFQEVDIGHGTQQARKCLKTIQAARYNSIAFVALDVEEASSISKTDAAKIVLDAGTEISSVLGKQPVIYTYLPDWQQIIGKKNVEFKGLPLWARTKGIFYDAGRNEHCGDGVPSLTPFSLPEQFGGWTALSGKQFDLGYAASGCASTFLAGVPVDFDVLDASLFPQ